MRKLILLLMIALAAISGVLTGCGGNSHSKPPATTSTTQTGSTGSTGPTAPKVTSAAPLTVTTGQSAGGSVHPPGWGSAPAGIAPPSPLVQAVPTREMYDTVTLATVPSNPFALAGYTAGWWPTYLPLRRKYPQAHTISIAIRASDHADCLDDEPGDATPGQAGPWARADIAHGYKMPCVYTSLSQMPSVKASLRAWLGSGWRSRVLLWMAWYRYRPGLVSGYDAVQWTDRSHNSNLDESTVTLNFLRIAQPPYSPPKPKPAPKPKPKPKPAPKPSTHHSARWNHLHRLIVKHCVHTTARYHHACHVWHVEIAHTH